MPDVTKIERALERARRARRRGLLGLAAAAVVGVALAGCGGEAGKGTGTASADDPLGRAEAAAMRLAKTLRGRLEEVMKTGGPTAAVAVCSTEAPALRAEIERETGVTVGRSSLRLRNPDDAGPEWVEAWLREQGERKAEGATGIRALADGPNGKVARVLKPLAIEAPCLKCHGAPAELAPEVKAILASQYPTDAAVGYGEGDLRGALWAEGPAAP